ncbi:uncharacterized protein TRAVEDRAFT_61366 [Trametes versicolor FP-101664 SS1]|uniref:uncharacterized protein n=1 Tax=Trametes versicolor (strain FP-101664) TaxID=717944 RepID=UPI00046225DE|nr:uncharacterized protein TRAVEDRAFT_61366 [Trametes versicolor FP-101664 SS1]EIW52453.1 hypothetical protein TRAVEDRAFT_61366 [Trametes versicolor FP-101664 SS1]
MPLELNGYSAHICCDDKELETYDVRVEDEKTISCWIPSEEGKAFTVHWGDDSSSTSMFVKVIMDGRKVGKTAHRPVATGRMDGARETSDTLRPFIFAPLVLTDDDALLDSGVNEDLGTIQIEMKLVEYFSEAKKFSAIHVPEIGSVHERSKKAGVHAVALGQPQEAKFVKSLKGHGIGKVPIATFKFRYRPLELLQANGVAPLPEKSRTLNKRPLGDMDKLDSAGPSSRKRQHTEPVVNVKPEAEDEEEEDMQFLEEQLQMMQRRVEKARAATKAKNIVKREVSPIRIPFSDSNDVIDLT